MRGVAESDDRVVGPLEVEGQRVARLGERADDLVQVVGLPVVIDETLLSQDIKNGEVKNADIGADAMTSSKLANGSVQNSDLGPDAITTSKIKAGNVGTTDVADDAILTGKIPLAGVRSACAVVCGAGTDGLAL